MQITVQYGVWFGSLDSVEDIYFNEPFELSEEEKKYAMPLVLTGEAGDLVDADEMKEIHDTIFKDVCEAAAMDLAYEADDEYVRDCMGWKGIDEDELVALVHNKDENALRYFNLTDASDEEIQEFDTCDIDDFISVEEFYPDFKPVNPFEEQYKLFIYLHEVFLEEQEVVNYLKDLFAEKDFETIDKIRKNYSPDNNYDLERDIKDIILDVAKEVGCQEYSVE